MKSVLVVLLLSVSAYAAPYKTLVCTASDKTMFGDLTLVLNTKPEVPTGPEFPPVNGSVDMFLTLDDVSKKMDTLCSAEPGNESNIVCAVIGAEAPLGLLMGDLNNLSKFTFTQDPISGKLYEYSCEEYPQAFTCKPTESNGLFGEATVTVDTPPKVVTERPTVTNGSVDVFLTLNNSKSKLDAYCLLNPQDKDQFACMAVQKDGDKEAPVVGFIINPKDLSSSMAMNGDSVFPYSCEKTKKEENKEASPK